MNSGSELDLIGSFLGIAIYVPSVKFPAFFHFIFPSSIVGKGCPNVSLNLLPDLVVIFKSLAGAFLFQSFLTFLGSIFKVLGFKLITLSPFRFSEISFPISRILPSASCTLAL